MKKQDAVFDPSAILAELAGTVEDTGERERIARLLGRGPDPAPPVLADQPAAELAPEHNAVSAVLPEEPAQPGDAPLIDAASIASPDVDSSAPVVRNEEQLPGSDGRSGEMGADAHGRTASDTEIERLKARWWELVAYDDAHPAKDDAEYDHRCKVFERLAGKLVAL